jgi:hypothetical protein
VVAIAAAVVVVVVVANWSLILKSIITDRIHKISHLQQTQFGNPWCTLLYVHSILTAG